MLSFKCVHVQVYNITQNLSTVVLNYGVQKYKIRLKIFEVLAKIALLYISYR